MPDKLGLDRASRRITLTVTPGSRKKIRGNNEHFPRSNQDIRDWDPRGSPAANNLRRAGAGNLWEREHNQSGYSHRPSKEDSSGDRGNKDSPPYKENGSPHKRSRGLYRFE
ncbi:hypothetical protein QLX08_009218 [Tetragonisca angustula]|uniref:Uncharacterized protein n=1 Tax=Tetragonisca angustula TaxID=166442 RepID=A0AAW0ZJM5_9HYME